MNFRLANRRLLPHPPERVWWALTDRDALAGWFMETTFEPRVGHRFLVRGTPVEGWRGWTQCEVLELTPPRRMVWSFLSTEEGAPTVVTFELRPVAPDATELVIRHEGDTDARTVALLEAGWPGFLDRLGGSLGRRTVGTPAGGG